ncbi:MAG TPA: DUF2203 domain-containing protein [Ignavibacteriaceae bacterium]|jgi:hypothetical protein|nr:DUF2203 domain-containing protein [Ignavibacteriaceae bacterium]
MITATRYFTPEEAHSTLPLVRKIVEDILNTSREIRLLTEDKDGVIESDPGVKKLAAQLNGFMAELEEIGCYYKDWNFSIGLVDFPAIIDGQEVFLCWRSDEDNVIYYHEIEAGYAGRKLIPEKYISHN